MNTFEINKGCFRVYFNDTAETLYVDEHRDFTGLPEPDLLYQVLKERGFSQERIIDVMLKILHTRRIFKGGWLNKLSLCIALIGPRGSGKSVGLTGIVVLDGLLAGRRVISNMPVAVNVRYRDCEKVFRTEDLDASMMLNENEFNANYYDALIAIDEVNTYVADSQRTMSNQSFFFANILQQMRHRKLDFIFTTQSESMNTNRVRFQTDFYIQCRDAAMFHGQPSANDIGRKSHWKIHDMSGLVTGEVMHKDARTYAVPPFTEKIFWNTPFWECYDTQQMQKREKHIAKKPGNGHVDGIDIEKLESLKATYERPVDLISKAIDLGMDRIEKKQLWETLGISGNQSMQTKIGHAMNELGCKTITGTRGREYVFPSQDEMKKNLAMMGLELHIKGGNNGE